MHHVVVAAGQVQTMMQIRRHQVARLDLGAADHGARRVDRVDPGRRVAQGDGARDIDADVVALHHVVGRVETGDRDAAATVG